MMNLFLICAAVKTETGNKHYKLLLVHMIMRHGDRAPIELYATDPNPKDSFSNGLGNLTELGKRQLMAHGTMIRNLYRDLLTGDSEEIMVNSSAVARCIHSAEYFLSTFTDQSIPVYSLPLLTDKYISPYFACPADAAEVAKEDAAPENVALLSEHKELLPYLSIHCGIPVNETKAIYLQDTLYIEKIHKLIIPDWVPPVWKEWTSFADNAIFSKLKSPTIQKLHAGPLLGVIADDMAEKASGNLPNLKFRLISAHDYNIAVVQHALQIYDARPPYVASLLLELHERNDCDYAVRVLYFNSTEPQRGNQQPHVLTLPGCSEFCPLEEFEKRVKDIMPDDYKMECATGQDVPNLRLWLNI